MPIEVLLVTLIIHRLLHEREKRILIQETKKQSYELSEDEAYKIKDSVGGL